MDFNLTDEQVYVTHVYNSGHILMTDLYSGLTVTATLPNMDPNTVIDTFFSHWVIGLNGDGFGIPNKYVFTSTGRKLDTKEGRKLCEELKLIWKYPKVGKVITLSPGCKPICLKGNFANSVRGHFTS